MSAAVFGMFAAFFRTFAKFVSAKFFEMTASIFERTKLRLYRKTMETVLLRGIR
jgi:hypothetical protein